MYLCYTQQEIAWAHLIFAARVLQCTPALFQADGTPLWAADGVSLDRARIERVLRSAPHTWSRGSIFAVPAFAPCCARCCSSRSCTPGSELCRLKAHNAHPHSHSPHAQSSRCLLCFMALAHLQGSSVRSRLPLSSPPRPLRRMARVHRRSRLHKRSSNLRAPCSSPQRRSRLRRRVTWEARACWTLWPPSPPLPPHCKGTQTRRHQAHSQPRAL